MKDMNSQIQKEVEKFSSLTEEDQLKAQAEYMSQLINTLPDPDNEEEFNEFIELYKNPPITGETDEERVVSFLNLSKTHPKFFSQCIALSAISMDLQTLGEVAQENAQKKSSVQSISREELDAIANEDKQNEIQKTRDLLSSIPIDD